MRALRYFFDEALTSLSRGYRTALLAVATIAAAFFVLGGLLMVTTNMERLVARWQEAAEFSVYLRDGWTPAERAAIDGALTGSPLVAAVELVTKDEAFRRFKETFGALAQTAGEVPGNPFPASIEVRLVSDADPAGVETLAQTAASLPGVADVRHDRRWIQRLLTAVRLIRAGGLALAAVLVFAAALTVASVVRLALVARRAEVHIMQLVGAPIAYIKGPFIVEGLIQGGMGATIAMAILWLIFRIVRARANPALAAAIDPASMLFLSLPVCAALLAGGMIVGSIGGLIAAGNTREIPE